MMDEAERREHYAKAADRCQEAADKFIDALASLPQGGLSTSPSGASQDRGRCLAGADLADSFRDRFAREAGQPTGSRRV